VSSWFSINLELASDKTFPFSRSGKYYIRCFIREHTTYHGVGDPIMIQDFGYTNIGIIFKILNICCVQRTLEQHNLVNKVVVLGSLSINQNFLQIIYVNYISVTGGLETANVLLSQAASSTPDLLHLVYNF
jgi:hypothetical protein